jgi:uncharacterized protein (DUF2252 family)
VINEVAAQLHLERTASAHRVTHLSVDERRELGRGARGTVKRSEQAAHDPPSGRTDPVELLLGQAEGRVESLVPLRHARMATSSFAFFRGTAIVQAADLGAQPHTGLTTQLCGDAHLSNLGLFASPDRRLVFDLNDFDETLPGPFEWDVKRLATSFILEARDIGLSAKRSREIAESCVRSYRELVRGAAGLGTLDVWYARIDGDSLHQYGASKGVRKRISKIATKAYRRTSEQVVGKLTEVVNGQRRFVERPPIVQRVDDVATVEILRDAVRSYRASVSADTRALLERYRFVDLAFKVVGVGSVGTRVFVMLLQGRDESDLLVLQVKQAEPSVLEPYLEPSVYANEGQRVVSGQRLLQSASDIFLGWQDGVKGHSYYWRQMRDWKYSADLATMTKELLESYARLCGHALARAHSRAGDPVAMAAYLGKGNTFDRAVARYGEAYADQVETDYAAFMQGIQEGRVPITELA